MGYFLKIFRSIPVAIILASCLTPILIVLALIIFPIVGLVLFLYKKCVIFVAKFKFPDAKILRKFDGLMSMGTEYTSTNLYIGSAIVLEGHISVEEVKRQFALVLDKRNVNGKLQNPTMQSYVDYFGGYSFYRKIKNFDAVNYIHRYKECETDGKIEMVDKLKLMDILKKLESSPFVKQCPLWEVMVVNNYRHNHSMNDPECTVVIFKLSHTLSDGFGTANFLYKNFAGFPLNLPKVDKREVKYQCWKYSNLLQIPVFCFIITFKWAVDLIHDPAKLINVHAWHKASSFKKTKFELWLSEPLSKSIFREIKSTCDVSVVSVVANVITGGMRRMMLARNLEGPKDMRIFFPIPKLNHPGTLTNHVSGVVIRIPLWIVDCKERLQATDKMIKESTFGVERVVSDYSLMYGNIIPNCLKRRFGYDFVTSAAISCVPLPSTDSKVFGMKLLSSSYFVSADTSNTGCLICILGLKDYFHMTIQMNSKLLNQPDEVKDLEKYMLEELDFIGKMCLA